MKVAVIGCGPAGLAAAHAAYGLGAEVTIFSPGVKSPQRGPLILQRPIPGITTDHPDGYIRQIVVGGSILDYRYKLYGDININLGRDHMLKEGYHCWNHIKAYDKLWRLYMGNDPDLPDENWNGRATRIDGMVRPTLLLSMITHRDYDLIVNTAPLIDLCRKVPSRMVQGKLVSMHDFRYKKVQITMGYSYPDQPEDTTVFNAGDDYPWVRSAWLLGNSCTEWQLGEAPKHLNPITIRKPIGHNCNCYPTVLGTGRFGAWRNEVWVDTAYYDTRDAIISMQRSPIWGKVK
jgi:hypothetical protein